MKMDVKRDIAEAEATGSFTYPVFCITLFRGTALVNERGALV